MVRVRNNAKGTYNTFWSVLWLLIRIRIILVTWIRIRIRIRIKTYKLNPEPDLDKLQFADVKPKCMVWNMSIFEHFFKVLSLFLTLGSGSGSA